MATFSKYSHRNIQRANGPVRRFAKALALGALLCALTLATTTATDVSGQVNVTRNGFGRHRTTGVWTSTLTVKNTTAKTIIAGPIQVALTNLTANVTMVNKTGMLNSDPYITVLQDALTPGASASVAIQFTNPNNQFIEFRTVTYSGGLAVQ